jgi:hypothetical protein
MNVAGVSRNSALRWGSFRKKKPATRDKDGRAVQLQGSGYCA